MLFCIQICLWDRQTSLKTRKVYSKVHIYLSWVSYFILLKIKDKKLQPYGCGTLCHAATLWWHSPSEADSSVFSSSSSSINLWNPLIMASIATLRGLAFFPVLLALLPYAEACWDPPPPAAEAITASAIWCPCCDSSWSQGLSSANCNHASFSLSSTWAGAVASPKKNSLSPSAFSRRGLITICCKIGNYCHFLRRRRALNNSKFSKR